MFCFHFLFICASRFYSFKARRSRIYCNCLVVTLPSHCCGEVGHENQEKMIYYEDQGHSNNSEVAFQTSVGSPPSWRFVCYELWQEGNRKVRQQTLKTPLGFIVYQSESACLKYNSLQLC